MLCSTAARREERSGGRRGSLHGGGSEGGSAEGPLIPPTPMSPPKEGEGRWAWEERWGGEGRAWMAEVMLAAATSAAATVAATVAATAAAAPATDSVLPPALAGAAAPSVLSHDAPAPSGPSRSERALALSPRTASPKLPRRSAPGKNHQSAMRGERMLTWHGNLVLVPPPHLEVDQDATWTNQPVLAGTCLNSWLQDCWLQERLSPAHG
ncbi:unnamed protein product [Closterium sp. NIES-54]